MNTVIDTYSMTPHVTGLRYDATQSSPRRGAIAVSTKSEDRELMVMGRLALSSQGRDLLRNFAIAGFAIRKHNQYVAKADFNCSIPNQSEYNALVKKFIYHWSRRQNCDIAGRHSLPELLVLIETHRVIDGDIGILKCSNGKIQLIEGDRIRDPMLPNKVDGYEWTHGVKVGNTGKAFRYAIHKRNNGGWFTFEREVSADNLILCGYYTRQDQVRGVSLLAPAINQFRDVYEGVDYALAKAKLGQLLGLVTHTVEDTRNTDEQNQQILDDLEKRIVERFGAGTLHLALRPDESAEMMDAHTPSVEFQEFIHSIIQLAFASLDMPYSFYDGSKANYYGTRGALDNYIESCTNKQTSLIEMLHEVTDWRLRMAIVDGELPPPPDGMTVDEMLWYCDWIGARMPLWRLIEDAKGYLVAEQCGHISPQKVTGMYGMNLDENLEEIKKAKDMAEKLGISLPLNQPLNIGA
jgi:capsid protein